MLVRGWIPARACGPSGRRQSETPAAGDMIYVVLANTRHDTGSRIEFPLEIEPA